MEVALVATATPKTCKLFAPVKHHCQQFLTDQMLSSCHPADNFKRLLKTVLFSAYQCN